MFRGLIAIVVTLAIILGAGWFVMKRDDIGYDRLESMYASKASRFMPMGEDSRIHYRDVGPRDAPVLVLVHGFSASLHTWEPWVKNLSKDYRVLTIDLPGHGLSRCLDVSATGIPQFVDVIDQVTHNLNVDQFTLVGNSMGGHTAWSYALAHPERLDGLVLVDASGWPKTGDEAESSPLVFKLLANPLARRVMKDIDMTGLIRSGLEDSFADPALVTDAMVERYGALSRAPCHREAILNLMTGRDDRSDASDEKLAAINVPTLIMQGEKDNLVPAAHAEKFHAAIAVSELKLYPDVGHLPQEEAAAQSVDDLRNFLSTQVYTVSDEALPEPLPAE
ncbi:alpha/beta fold hydrolase [Hyphomonas oceanitis]|uniref:Alpha/beta fold family hydrolase n=1 Tax=Hyphomonas oceanitis SCH89 TaxID=1280953 RepID=A0A059GAE8_9PROT|nr:alpha/beta hydrolase [Hyphomonas oceanitis]KDA03423.1 alpha/beta fold family hydrolase [Hyphomonas oceanitis SCH89]